MKATFEILVTVGPLIVSLVLLGILLAEVWDRRGQLGHDVDRGLRASHERITRAYDELRRTK